MASNILTIYDELAATSISVDGTSVTAKDADQLPNRVASADLPVRLITPISEFGSDNSISTSIWNTSGGSAVREVTWVIQDVMLWKPVTQETGVKAWAKSLVDYQKQYLTMLESLSLSGAVKVDVSMSATIIEYPLLSGNFYAGVRATLNVKEKY